MNPESFKYTQDHEWVYIENETATVGITKHATDELGDVVFVELYDEGESLKSKDEFGTVESVKTVSSLYSPVDGEIIEKNEDVLKDPNLLNESPLDKAWLIKIKIDPSTNLDDLMSFDAYQSYIETL